MMRIAGLLAGMLVLLACSGCNSKEREAQALDVPPTSTFRQEPFSQTEVVRLVSTEVEALRKDMDSRIAQAKADAAFNSLDAAQRFTACSFAALETFRTDTEVRGLTLARAGDIFKAAVDKCDDDSTKFLIDSLSAR